MVDEQGSSVGETVSKMPVPGFSGMTPQNHAAPADASEELARTWRQALLFLPPEQARQAPGIMRLADWPSHAGHLKKNSLPVIVYLHGCSGIDAISHAAGEFYAAQGFAVIMPNSYGRTFKPSSCDPSTYIAGLHREVLRWREEEARHAIERAPNLPWADGANIFLAGFSEGANAAATFQGTPVSGRIIEGWTCHAGWREYRGLKAPREEPVLSLVGLADPWFQKPYLVGDCGRFMADRAGGRSVSYAPPHDVSHHHYLLWHPDVRREVAGFLHRNLR